MAFVHCLSQAIGVKEYALTRLQYGFLSGVNHVVHHAQRQMWLGSQLLGFLADNKWLVVTGIAIAEPSGGHVKHPDEHGDEHILFVALTGCFV